MAVHKRSIGSLIFDALNGAFLIVLCVSMLYPLYYVFAASVSDGYRLMAHTGPLAGPLGFSGAAYRMVFNNPMVVCGFLNSRLWNDLGLARLARRTGSFSWAKFIWSSSARRSTCC